MSYMVRVEGVRKRYGRRTPEVLAGIDLELEAGRPVVVRGTNGSGKSTLLRIVAGVAAPTSGRVSGRPRVVGYLPDRFPAQQRMPVGVYLRHLAAIHGDRSTAADAAGLLAALAFSGTATTPMLALSKGNAQKVGLAQALTCGAGLVVLDEPWSGLDAEAAAALRTRVDAVAAAGAAVLVADHSPHGQRLAGATVYRLESGVLHVEEPEPDTEEITVVEIGGHGDPRPVMPPGIDCRVAPGDGRTEWRMRLRVPASRGDAILAALLARGATVLSVRREPSTTRGYATAMGRHGRVG